MTVSDLDEVPEDNFVRPLRLRLAAWMILLAGSWVAAVPGLAGAGRHEPSTPQRPLETFLPADVPELRQVLDAALRADACEDHDPPNVAPDRLPAGLATLEADARKEMFLRALLPHVLHVNRAVAEDRSRLRELEARITSARPLDAEQKALLGDLRRRYRVPAEDAHAVLSELMLRVDRIPAGLALAQAAIESAWGTSRFALEGNALFGQWIFSPNRGMVPQGRPEGARYSVARFDTLRGSVASYVRNLNTGWAYADLRAMRAEMRGRGAALDSLRLSDGLLYYSVRREEYVREVKQIIRNNRLTRFDDSAICSVKRTAAPDPRGSGERVVTAEPGSRPPDA